MLAIVRPIIALMAVLVGWNAAVARPKSRVCELQLELPGIFDHDAHANPVSRPPPPIDLGPALRRGLRLAAVDPIEWTREFGAALPGGFVLHGGSVIELDRARRDGGFHGATTDEETLGAIAARLDGETLAAGRATRVLHVLAPADFAAEGRDPALIEIANSVAKSAAVAARVLGVRRAKPERFDALAPLLEDLASRNVANLRMATRSTSFPLETRRLVEEYLRYYRDPSAWTLGNANLREGVLFVFRASTLWGKVTTEDPREIGTVVALTPRQSLDLADLWAIIPLSKYDRSDLISILPDYAEIFSARRGTGR